MRLIEIMAALRAPGGCPWDREQTIDTLKKYVLEETYELLEAIDRHDHEALREELGDFLFEAVFVAQLEAEAGHFSIADSVRAVADAVPIPVIASGGGGSAEDLAAALDDRPQGGHCQAALAASIFHFGEVTVGEVKRRLGALGVPVRPPRR